MEANEMTLHPKWEFVADTVMGGISTGEISQEVFEGREATVLRGHVSLDNNGGFIQMAFDLRKNGSGVDVSEWDGIELTIWGNDQNYDVRLRTDQLTRPWQSFRTDISSQTVWQTIRVPFATFIAHKVDVVLDTKYLRRIGILAIGREFDALVAVSSIRFYCST
jgi:hypothetical protein